MIVIDTSYIKEKEVFIMKNKKQTIRRKKERNLKNINKEAGLNLDALRMDLCETQNIDSMNNTMNSNFVITKFDGITYIENGKNINDYGGQIEWSEIIY